MGLGQNCSRKTAATTREVTRHMYVMNTFEVVDGLREN